MGMRDTVVLAENESDASNIIATLTKEKRLLQVIYDGQTTEIDSKAENIVCCTSLKKVANYIENNTLKNLIITAGFAGCDILAPTALQEKYRKTQLVKDSILSKDVDSTDRVLKSSKDKIEEVYMLGKNIEDMVSKQGIANEIVNILNNKELSFKYLGVNPYYNSEEDMWGSELYIMFKEGRTRLTKTAVGVN